MISTIVTTVSLSAALLTGVVSFLDHANSTGTCSGELRMLDMIAATPQSVDSDQATALQIARVQIQCIGARADVSDNRNLTAYARALAGTQAVIDRAQRAVDAKNSKS